MSRASRAAAWGLAFGIAFGCGGNEYVEPPPPEVTVSQPLSKEVTEYFEFTGSLVSVGVVDVRARVKGVLLSRDFEFGEVVEEGQLLYRIDPREYQAAVARAKASLAKQRATLGLKQARLERLEEARKSRAVSEIEVIEAKAERDEAQAFVAAAKAELVQAELDLSYTEVRAPITGRAALTYVDPGNLVGSGESTLLTRLVQYHPIYVDFDMSERTVLALIDAADERRGREPEQDEETRLRELREIPLDLGRANDAGYPFRGHLYYADPEVDRETGTLLMRGLLDNPDPVRLLPGTFARVRIPFEEDHSALLIDDRAVGTDQSGRFVLVVDEDDVVQQRQVVLGGLVDGMRIIESGLEPTERVIVNGLLRARPGAKVRPLTEDETPVAASAPAGD